MFMSIPFVYGDQCPCRNKDLTNTTRLKNVANMIKRRVSFSSTNNCDDKDCKINHPDSLYHHHHHHHHHHHQQHDDDHHCSALDDTNHCHLEESITINQEHIKSKEENIVHRENTDNDTSLLSSIKSITSKEEQSTK